MITLHALQPDPPSGPQTEAERYRKAAHRSEIATTVAKVIMWLILVTGAVAFMMPLYIMLVMSLKTPSEISKSSAWAWPMQLTWDNFRTVLQNPDAPFDLFFRNTTIISISTTIGVLLSSALVAFPFARLRFRGRDRLFVLLLSTMMLPGIVTMIPTYVLYKYLHWVDTFNPLIIPAFFGGGAYNIFLLRQFFMGIPRELDEAALLDGASYSRVFWNVIIPNSGAALATVGIFNFIYSWRDFMGPLLYLNDPRKQTLELGLRTYQTLNSEHWELLMAGSVIVMIPLLTLFVMGQRYFVKGIVMSGMK